MSQRLRIAHISTTPGIGGSGKATYTLIREQLKDPELNVGLLTGEAQNRWSRELINLGCRILPTHTKSGFDLTQIPIAIKFLRQYEIHHFHTLIPSFIIASVLCGQKCRIYTNRSGYSMRRERIKIPLYSFFLRHFFIAFTGNTQYAALVAANHYKIPSRNSSIIYNGLDFSEIVPQYSRTKFRLSHRLHEHFVIGAVSLLHKGKSIERLLRGAAMLENLSFRILIVGDGPGKQDLINEAKHLDIEDKTIFAGMQVPPYAYIKAMDIFVFPSASQSFGNVLIEAMSLKVPVIVFADSGGLLEHIQDGKTGFVVKDEQELAQCIQRLAADEKLRKEVGKAGSLFVRKKYTLAKMTKGYKKVYLSALDK